MILSLCVNVWREGAKRMDPVIYSVMPKIGMSEISRLEVPREFGEESV